MKKYILIFCFLVSAVCLTVLTAQVKPANPTATYSPLSRVWLPPVAQGKDAPENAYVVGEQGQTQEVFPEYVRSGVARSLKARPLEVLAWLPQTTTEPAYQSLRQTILARLRAAHYVVRATSFPPTDGGWKGEFGEAFEASRDGRVLAGVWYRSLDYLALMWGERVPQTAQRKRDDALLEAAEYDQLKEVKNLLALGANVNARDYDEKTPLMLAAAKNNIEVMRLLLAKGAKPNARDVFGETALLQSMESVTTRLLLEKGADPNARLSTGGTALILAATWGREDTVRLLLDHKADPNVVNENGRTALSWAAYRPGEWFYTNDPPVQYPAIVKLLLERGADPNRGIESGWNAITLAAQDDQAGVVPMMIEASKDKAALLRATARHGQNAIVQTILGKGADINGASPDGATALMEAARSAESRTVQLLLDKIADANRRDKAGRNALMWACLPPLYALNPDAVSQMTKNLDATLTLLLKAKIDLEARDKQGLTALAIAAAHGHSAAVNLLLARGANADATTQAGNTALHQAAARYGVTDDERAQSSYSGIGSDADYRQILKDLLKAGVTINARNAAGQTALTLALARGHRDFATALKAAGATR